MNKDFSIEIFLDLSFYVTEKRKNRRKDKNKQQKCTQEFFTPYSIVKRMADKIPDSDWEDPTKTFLESSFGNDQFVAYIVCNRITYDNIFI